VIVEKKADADHPARPQLGNMRHDEAGRPYEVPGDAQQDLALGERFAHQLELVLLEVAQPAVDQLGGRRRGGARQVAPLDENRRQAAAGRVARNAGAVDATADDQQVVDHPAAACLLQRVELEDLDLHFRMRLALAILGLLGSRDCFKAGPMTLRARRGLGGLSCCTRKYFRVVPSRQRAAKSL
jgi:hypothetical protein